MQIRELSKPITSKALNESLAKKFGYKLNLEQFSDVQLEDARNKLRTKISQFEVNESYDSLHESPDYQKTRMFLDTINQEIMEREEKKEQCECDTLGQKECPVHCDDEPKKQPKHEHNESRIRQVKADKMKEKAMEHSVPESWINSALARIELGESDEAELSAELTTRYDLSEDTANYILYLAEGEGEVLL